LRLVVIFSLIWAVFGALGYGWFLSYMGWESLGFELKWMIFVGLSLTGAAISTAYS
jgi:hypothetical protein